MNLSNVWPGTHQAETPMKILIADDSGIVVDRLAEMLAGVPEANVVGTASTVTQAKEIVARLSPELVILDLHMPEGSGIEVLENIKRTKPETVVVILTNFATPLLRERCLKAGADGFLDKSSEFDKVPELLKLAARRERLAPRKAS